MDEQTRRELLDELNRCVGMADKYGPNQTADANLMAGRAHGIECALGVLGWRVCWVPDGSKPARAVDVTREGGVMEVA